MNPAFGFGQSPPSQLSMQDDQQSIGIVNDVVDQICGQRS
jgi:hypothetical protein